jgi:hypothetical protein
MAGGMSSNTTVVIVNVALLPAASVPTNVVLTPPTLPSDVFSSPLIS